MRILRWFKDNVSAIIVFLAVSISVVSLPTIAIQGYDANRSQNNHHAASVRQQDEIIALIKEVKSAQADGHAKLNDLTGVEMQVASVILGLPPADAALGRFAVWLEICVGQDHEVNCPAPPIPTS